MRAMHYAQGQLKRFLCIHSELGSSMVKMRTIFLREKFLFSFLRRLSCSLQLLPSAQDSRPQFFSVRALYSACYFSRREKASRSLLEIYCTVRRVFFQTLCFAFVIVVLAEMGRIPCCGRPESSSSNI